MYIDSAHFQTTAAYVFYIAIFLNPGEKVDILCSSQNLLVRSCSFEHENLLQCMNFMGSELARALFT
jgi:hypothetical protein